MGMEWFLVKPISQSTLHDTVMNVFGHTDRLGTARPRARTRGSSSPSAAQRSCWWRTTR